MIKIMISNHFYRLRLPVMKMYRLRLRLHITKTSRLRLLSIFVIMPTIKITITFPSFIDFIKITGHTNIL